MEALPIALSGWLIHIKPEPIVRNFFEKVFKAFNPYILSFVVEKIKENSMDRLCLRHQSPLILRVIRVNHRFNQALAVLSIVIVIIRGVCRKAWLNINE
jgi:hypothetical protein